MIAASLHHVKIPLRRPFGHVLATRHHAEAIVMIVEADGATGVGECVPRPYVTGETFESVWQAIGQLRLADVYARVDGASPATLARSVEQLPLPGLAARCAVELALLDLRCKLAGWPLAALAFALDLPRALVSEVSEAPLPEVISVPLDLRSEPADLAHLVGSRLGHVKVKVGAELAADVRRVGACRDLFGAAVTMSVDANMAWTLDEAVRAADALRRFDLAWFEEPLQPALRDRYPALRARAGIAVMLDEAACSAAQTRDAIASGACDLVNIRLSKHGGYLPALRIAELAHRAGVRYQHGTQVGQLGILNAAGRHFTSVVRGIVACEGGPGLANLSDHPTRTKVELDWTAGHLVGLYGPGIGVEIDRAKLRAYSIRSMELAW
jgi:L-alanine-DL-glutamate epimerase-like enolase superfamily enzyme